MNFTIEFIGSPVGLDAIQKLASRGFGNMLKSVVDVEKEIMAVGAEMHFDEEQFLLESGSIQSHLWGINIRPVLPFPESVEFDSMINIRPGRGNRTRGVEDIMLQKRILDIVKKLVYDGKNV